MFCDQPITYLDSPVILGRYLEPAIDIVSDMTYKILKTSVKYVCRATFQSLNPIDIAFSEHT